MSNVNGLEDEGVESSNESISSSSDEEFSDSENNLTLDPASQSMLNVSIDDFTCPICLDLMVEPISLSCGHSHCRTCLVELGQRGAKKCPSCRATINQSINLLDAPQCILLARIIQSAFPLVYEKRQVINQTIKQSWKCRFPVCFIDTVLFPHQNMLVHLYEPRYKIMCERLINQSNSQPIKRFALFSTRSQSSLDDAVGVLVEASDITRSSNDTYLVYITAVERCTIAECWEEPETHALYQADDDALSQSDDELIQSHMSAIRSSIQCFDSLSESCGSGRSFQREFGSVPTDPCSLSFWLFSCLLNDRSARGDSSVENDNLLVPEVLSSRSILWRLQRGFDMLNEAVQQLRVRASAQMNAPTVSRVLQSSAPEYRPVSNSYAVPSTNHSRSVTPRQGHHGARLSMRHPPRGYAPRNRAVWPFASAEQQLRHYQPYRD
jgi:hypothetical protein